MCNTSRQRANGKRLKANTSKFSATTEKSISSDRHRKLTDDLPNNGEAEKRILTE
ncbi:MAG: hypothetical protein LC105_12145 [Chitinophagales bacterium]|nr:hypothetical protein [Chitinophagales bacterium]